MKETADITVCVRDFGMFLPVARALSKHVKKVYYTTPTEKGFQEIGDFVLGDGVPNVERINDFLSPAIFDEIDLFVFPYILDGGLQEHLVACGKAVWGARKADELERMKGRFYKMLESVGLEVPPHEVIIGMTNLRLYLKEHENVFIKISNFRGTMDTWKHNDYQQSMSYLDMLACKLGPFQDTLTFYVVHEIKTDIEGGIDTYCIDGQWPDQAVMGYEKKNETYLAAVRPWGKLPKIYTDVNQAISPVLASYQYRQFFSTEVRVKDDVSYFIDPTCFSSDTEILTVDGWRRFPQLTGAEEVATLNKSTRAIEYQQPTALIAKRYSGEMVLITSPRRTIECLVTPDHNIWRTNRHNNNLFPQKASELTGSGFVPRTGAWTGTGEEFFILPEYSRTWHSGKGVGIDKTKHCPSVRIPMNDWLRFLAIYLAEGSLGGTATGEPGRRYQANISQYVRMDEVEAILCRLPFKYQKTRGGFSISSIQLTEYLKRFGLCHEKYVPGYVKALPPSQIWHFLDAYFIGDGCSRKGRKQWHWITTSRRMADDLQELVFKFGLVANIAVRPVAGSKFKLGGRQYIRRHNSFIVTVRHSFKDFWFETFRGRRAQYLKSVPYDGMVYCVTVPNHIIYVRRNGKPFWCGNCRTASPAGEEMLDLFTNLGEIFWYGAHGQLVQPVIKHKFAGEAYLHWTGDEKEWKCLRVPEELQEKVKIYGSAFVDGAYWWPPEDEEVIGCIVGVADSPSEVIDDIKETVEGLGDAPISVNIASFVDLVKEIEKAEENDIDFSDKELPEPAEIME